jgi:hypothetical protein
MQKLTNKHEISKKKRTERKRRAEKIRNNIFREDTRIENSFAQKRMTPTTWPHEKTWQNKDIKKGIINTISNNTHVWGNPKWQASSRH